MQQPSDMLSSITFEKLTFIKHVGNGIMKKGQFRFLRKALCWEMMIVTIHPTAVYSYKTGKQTIDCVSQALFFIHWDVRLYNPNLVDTMKIKYTIQKM